MDTTSHGASGDSEREKVAVKIAGLKDLDFIDKDEASVQGGAQHRLRYQAEARVIRAKIGDLEEVRRQLGISRRKMCQMLLVDPSAWTRWTKNPERVPPHVFRSLQWYMALIDKNPEWHPQNSYLKMELASQTEELNVVRDRVLKKLAEMGHVERDMRQDIERILAQTKEDNQLLQSKLEEQGGIGLGWKLLLLINTGLLIYYAIFSR